jgi:hypothetical protein
VNLHQRTDVKDAGADRMIWIPINTLQVEDLMSSFNGVGYLLQEGRDQVLGDIRLLDSAMLTALISRGPAVVTSTAQPSQSSAGRSRVAVQATRGGIEAVLRMEPGVDGLPVRMKAIHRS